MLTTETVHHLIQAHTKHTRETNPEIAEFRRNMTNDRRKVESLAIADSDKRRKKVRYASNPLYEWFRASSAVFVPARPGVQLHAMSDTLEGPRKVREALCNTTFTRRKFRRELKDLYQYACITGRGILQAVWNMKYRRVEVTAVDPRLVWFDTESRWDKCRYLIRPICITSTEWENRKKRAKGKDGKPLYNMEEAKKIKPSGYPKWYKLDGSRMTITEDAFEWYILYEVHDFVSGSFAQYLGSTSSTDPVKVYEQDTPLYPNLPKPFTLYEYENNLLDRQGVSMAQLLKNLMESVMELERLRIGYAQKGIPRPYVDTTNIKNPEAFLKKFSDWTFMKVLPYERKNQSIHGDPIQFTPAAPSFPAFDNLEADATAKIERITGVGDLQRGLPARVRVASDAVIANANSEGLAMDQILKFQELIEWAAEAIVALYEQFLPESTKIPVEKKKTGEKFSATRKSLAFKDGLDPSGVFEWQFEAEASDLDPNDRRMLLATVEKWYGILKESPNVDQRMLDQWLLDLIKAGWLMVDPSQNAPAQANGPQAPPALSQDPAGVAQNPANGENDLPSEAGGDLPIGTEPPPIMGSGGPGNPINGASGALGSGGL